MAGRLALAALSLLAAIGCQSPRERSGTAMATDAPATRPFISCESLAQEVKWMPWLSEPGSRLVLNPTVGNQARNLTPATVPGLPMSLAYFVGERPVTMPGFWSWSVAKQGDAAAIKPHDLGADHAAWRVEGGSVGRDGTSARITIHPGPVAFIERSITADLSQTPWLLVTVPALPDGVSFAVKVNDARGGPDIFLQRDTRQPQTGAYDVAAATGWTGERTFNVRLFAVGKEGQHVVFDAPKLVAGPDVTPLQSTGVTWEPHRVRAKAAGGGMRIESTIAFPHLDSVAQSITVTDGEGALVLSGDVSGGEAHWDESRRELSIVYEHFTATLATSATGQPTRFGGVWRDRQRYLEGEAPTAATPGGVWELAFDVRSGDRVVVTAGVPFDVPGTTNLMKVETV